MGLFRNGLKARVMSTELIIEADVSKRVLFLALQMAKEFEERYSAYKTSSLVGQINQNAGKKALECRSDDIDLFHATLEVTKRTRGVFDPTIGALTQGTWGFGTKEAKVPTQKELQCAKELVNFHDFLLQDNKAFLKKEGMRLDFGGIGKGFLAQKLCTFLQTKGAKKILVNVGGEIVTFGKRYFIAIKNPFADGNIAVIKTKKEPLSITTSGDYERFIGSKRYHHILSVSTAKQNHYYSSVTLLKNGLQFTWLDALSTLVFNTPPNRLLELAQEYEMAIIVITPNQEIFCYNLKNLAIDSLEFYSFS